MKLHKDLREFVELLNSLKVEYVVVGGHAVAFHGHPRFTGDIDFLLAPTAANAARVIACLRRAKDLADVATLVRIDRLRPR